MTDEQRPLLRSSSTMGAAYPRARTASLFWRTDAGGGGPTREMERTVSVLDVISGRRLISEYMDAASQNETESEADRSAGRSLQWHHLMLIIYFNAIGGPFGLEPAVATAGPLLAIVGVIGCGLIWCLPQALMSAELSLLCQDEGNGGNFNWVYRAFGPGACFINAVNGLLNSAVANAITLLLIPQYLNSPSFTFMDNALLMGAFAALAGLLNVLSPSAMGRVNLFYTPFMFIPFFVLFAVYWDDGGLRHTSADVLLERPPAHAIQWSLFLSTVIWCFGGFDAVGNAAGDIVGGRATYMKGLFGALLMGIVNYLVPIGLAYMISPHYTLWGTGYLSTMGFLVAPWCGKLMRATAISACFFSYSASVFPMARLVWAAAVCERDRQLFPRWIGWSFTYSSGAVSPVIAIIATSLATYGCALGPYVFLVEVYMCFRIVNLLAEYASLFALRYKEPEAERAFLIPGGYPVLVVMLLPTLAVMGVLCSSAGALSLLVGFGVQPLFAVCYYIRAWVLRCEGRRSVSPSSDMKSKIND